jgi:hypothetical protein
MLLEVALCAGQMEWQRVLECKLLQLVILILILVLVLIMLLVLGLM